MDKKETIEREWSDLMTQYSGLQRDFASQKIAKKDFDIQEAHLLDEIKLREQLLQDLANTHKREKPIVLRNVGLRNPPKANYEMKCIECGKVFLANRRTAKYCSNYCSRLHRGLTKPIIKMI